MKKNKTLCKKFSYLFTEAEKIFVNHWISFFLIGIFLGLLSGIQNFSALLFKATGDASFFVLDIIFYILLFYFFVGYLNFLIKLGKNKEARMRDLFEIRSLSRLILIFLTFLGVKLFTVFGFIFFIIPGIIIGIALLFAKYIIIENENADPEEALRLSWRMTKGHRWHLFFLIILAIFFNILGFLAFVVGLLVTIPITQLVFVLAYKNLSEEFHKDHE